MNKIILWILGIIIIGGGAFLYATRPVQTDTTVATNETVAKEQLAATAPEQKLYRIDSANSKVQFSITEELRGKPFTAVGTTNQVAGDIIVGTTDGKASLTAGTITIDANTFKTDSAQRDGAITRFIIKTGTEGNQYITFKATSISALPAVIETGKPFSFTATGNLTLAGITKPATLAVTATQTDSALTGTIKSTLKRSDYSLTIPNIPFVANVPDT
ncbi:MAG: YceI family protein, partial [Patescibacteria group bacterium]